VVSTAYDLRPPPASPLEGFADVQHYTNDGGDFSVDGPDSKSTPTDSVTKVPSFMSYTDDNDRAWTDARIHQQLIDRGSGSSGGSGWSANGSSGSDSANSMLSATGEVDADGSILYDDVMAFRGVNEYTDLDEEPVEVALVGPDEEVLVRTAHEGGATSMNPIERSVRDAVGRVPRAGLAGDPETAREDVGGALDVVASLVTDGAYAEAAGTMDGRVRERVRENVVDHEPRLGERSPEGLLSLVDETVGRLRGVAGAGG